MPGRAARAERLGLVDLTHITISDGAGLLFAALAGFVGAATPFIVSILRTQSARLQRLEEQARDNQEAISHLQNGGTVTAIDKRLTQLGLATQTHAVPPIPTAIPGGRRATDGPAAPVVPATEGQQEGTS